MDKIFCFLFLVFISVVFATEMDWYADSIEITTEEQLREFANQVSNGNTFEGKIIALINNIDIKGGEWRRIIGSVSKPFKGTFDGKGNVISGVNINNSHDCLGLFAHLDNGTIKNLGVQVDINGRGIIGGLVGINNGTIENSYVIGSVKGERGDIGGLVGFNTRTGVIKNSYSKAIVEGFNSVGGLTGSNLGGTITNSYAMGNVRATVFGNRDVHVFNGGWVGGLAGYNNGTITDCYATGNVEGISHAGGLVGFTERRSIIINCYAIGNVRTTGRDGLDMATVGELIGRSKGIVTDCYAIGKGNRMFGVNINRRTSPTSKLKTREEMKQQETFVNWDFDNIWGIGPAINGGFPHLRVFQQ